MRLAVGIRFLVSLKVVADEVVHACEFTLQRSLCTWARGCAGKIKEGLTVGEEGREGELLYLPFAWWFSLLAPCTFLPSRTLRCSLASLCEGWNLVHPSPPCPCHPCPYHCLYHWVPPMCSPPHTSYQKTPQRRLCPSCREMGRLRRSPSCLCNAGKKVPQAQRT